MGKIALGRGSEWHLLRYLGRHRMLFDRRVLDRLNMTEGLSYSDRQADNKAGRRARADRIDWLDFGFGAAGRGEDREIVGLRFLHKDSPARAAWTAVWPGSGNSQNWDAVASVARADGSLSWLLVEAKAHLGELSSACQATEESLAVIRKALDATRDHLAADPAADWTRPYYQLANRLVVLDHLVRHNEEADLLLLYFTGDKPNLTGPNLSRPGPSGRCPVDAEGWASAIEEQWRALGLPKRHALSDRVHDLFLEVG